MFRLDLERRPGSGIRAAPNRRLVSANADNLRQFCRKFARTSLRHFKRCGPKMGMSDCDSHICGGAHAARPFSGRTATAVPRRFWRSPLIPLIGLTGAAIDYSRAPTRQGRHADRARFDRAQRCRRPRRTTTARRRSRARRSRFSTPCSIRPEAQNVSIKTASSVLRSRAASLSTSDRHGTVKTYFAERCSAIGRSSFGYQSEILWGIKKLNLALALDNTGSMASSGKMTALKTAAHNLLNTLQAAEKMPGDIKVSIIPFAVDVNVGTANVDATWIDWDRLGSRQRQLQQVELLLASRAAATTAAPGRRRPTASGTAASTIATRTTTCTNTPTGAGAVHQVPRASGVGLPDRDDAAVDRLDRAAHQGRRHDADRQHQRHHRHAVAWQTLVDQ